MSPAEAAARLGVSEATIRRWIAGGELPARRIGGRVLIGRGAIDAIIADADGATGGFPNMRAPAGVTLSAGSMPEDPER